MNIKIINVNAKVPQMFARGKPVLDEKGKKIFIDKDVVLKADVDIIKKRGFEHFKGCHNHINFFYNKNMERKSDIKDLWKEITGEPVPKKA